MREDERKKQQNIFAYHHCTKPIFFTNTYTYTQRSYLIPFSSSFFHVYQIFIIFFLGFASNSNHAVFTTSTCPKIWSNKILRPTKYNSIWSWQNKTIVKIHCVTKSLFQTKIEHMQSKIDRDGAEFRINFYNQKSTKISIAIFTIKRITQNVQFHHPSNFFWQMTHRSEKRKMF